MRKIVVFAVLIAIALPLIAAAQQMGPPNVLVIYREDVKPGKQLSHEKSEAGWAQAVSRAKWPEYYLGMTSVSGPNQAWFTYGYESMAAVEKDQQAQDKSAAMKAVEAQYLPPENEYVAEGRTIIAKLAPDLTLGSGVELGQMRYFRVRTSRIKFGHDEEYMELRKMLNAAMQRAGTNVHSVVFQVISGAPAGTYLTFYPIKSLAELDQPVNLREILGSDYERFMSLVDKSVAGYSDDIFQFNPKMSYPPPNMVKADPGFWTPKVAMAKAAAPTGDKTAAAPAKKDANKGK